MHIQRTTRQAWPPSETVSIGWQFCSFDLSLVSSSEHSHREHAQSRLPRSERLVDLRDGVICLPDETASNADRASQGQRTSDQATPHLDSPEQYNTELTSATANPNQTISYSDRLVGEGSFSVNQTMSSVRHGPALNATIGVDSGKTTDISTISHGSVAAHDVLPNSGVLEASEVWNDLNEFFESAYITFPVLSQSQLILRLIEEPFWSQVPEFRTLLLSIRLVVAAGRYRMSPQSEPRLFDLIRLVERSRLFYDFAESPTLDEVVVSLFLFTAYNVAEKHNHAFLYLDEAAFLLDAVEPKNEGEKRRKLQLEKVLFNTETATLAIYAQNNKARRSRRPLINLDDQWLPENGTEALSGPEWVAMHLLRRLTQINLAEDANSLQSIDIESDADKTTLFGAAFHRHRSTRIQAADVVVTRQWRLSTKLLTEPGPLVLLHNRASIAENLGTAAMAWVCLLAEGELRVVGLGKLSGLAQNIHGMTGGQRCQYVLAGLAGAVIKEDHEKHFAPVLADVIGPMVSTPPRLLSLPGCEVQRRRAASGNRHTIFEEGFAFGTEVLSASMPTTYSARDGLSFINESGESEQDGMLFHENVDSFFDVT